MVLRSEEEVGGSKEENKLEIKKKGLWCVCITWPPGPKSLTHIKPCQWWDSALSGLKLLPLIRIKCAT